MREIQASEAKIHLAQLLDEVERGETLVITRHGRAIARLVPETQRRKRTGKIALDELLSARHEGHKY
jgi:prevent-host-death family protein